MLYCTVLYCTVMYSTVPDSSLVLAARQHVEDVRDLGGAARQRDRGCGKIFSEQKKYFMSRKIFQSVVKNIS